MNKKVNSDARIIIKSLCIAFLLVVFNFIVVFLYNPLSFLVNLTIRKCSFLKISTPVLLSDVLKVVALSLMYNQIIVLLLWVVIMFLLGKKIKNKNSFVLSKKEVLMQTIATILLQITLFVYLWF
ncbi:MAG: hypothetical protein K5890_11275 [Bacteroidales bacterium]|nr:hypothetical protein [Bacteroidales bacterium]